MKMWCMLRTVPRSTRHSAVGLPYADAVHSPPNIVRSNLFPSTARSAEYFMSVKGWSCHVDFPKARFSVKCSQFVVFDKGHTGIIYTCTCKHELSEISLYFYLSSFSTTNKCPCLCPWPLNVYSYVSTSPLNNNINVCIKYNIKAL